MLLSACFIAFCSTRSEQKQECNSVVQIALPAYQVIYLNVLHNLMYCVKAWCVHKYHKWRQITILVIRFRHLCKVHSRRDQGKSCFFPPRLLSLRTPVVHLLNPGVQNDIWLHIAEPLCSWPGEGTCWER